MYPHLKDEGFEVLTAVVTKNSAVWDITPCSPLKVNRRFGRTCLHLQGGRVSQVRSQQVASGAAASIALFAAFCVIFGVGGRKEWVEL
jgi:hypothetical protein